MLKKIIGGGAISLAIIAALGTIKSNCRDIDIDLNDLEALCKTKESKILHSSIKKKIDVLYGEITGYHVNDNYKAQALVQSIYNDLRIFAKANRNTLYSQTLNVIESIQSKLEDHLYNISQDVSLLCMDI